MTYAEAENLVEQHQNLIGKPLITGVIEHMIISNEEKLSEVIGAYLDNGRNNRLALHEVGILGADLEIFLFPSFHIGLPVHETLDRYLMRNSL